MEACTRDGLFSCCLLLCFPVCKRKKSAKEGVLKPRIELGPAAWQAAIMPLDYLSLVAAWPKQQPMNARFARADCAQRLRAHRTHGASWGRRELGLNGAGERLSSAALLLRRSPECKGRLTKFVSRW